jgi:replication-associated recombination protein RarA
VLLYGAYGTGKSTAVELIARDRGAAKSDIHYVRVNGSQFAEIRKSSTLVNAMLWGVINPLTPVLIVDEVDMLSKENQLWLRSFIDDWQHRALILLTTNYIGNLDGSIRDRCDCMEVKGFTALQAAELIHNVLAQHTIRIAVSRIEQQAQLELSSNDAMLSLRTVSRLCDKLTLQFNPPKLRIVKT